MRAESWLKIICDNCQKANWACEGDPCDMTGCDTEAVRCWSCGDVMVLTEDDCRDDDEMDVEDGLQQPR